MMEILSLSTFNPYSVCAVPKHPPTEVQTCAAISGLLLLDRLIGPLVAIHTLHDFNQ